MTLVGSERNACASRDGTNAKGLVKTGQRIRCIKIGCEVNDCQWVGMKCLRGYIALTRATEKTHGVHVPFPEGSLGY